MNASKPIVEVRHLSKLYRIGVIGPTTLRETTERLFSKFRRNGAGSLPTRSGRQIDPQRAGTEANTFWALKDVSFDVQAGEAVGIIGRNGAGKSTLLKLLSRITEPTSGRAVLRGRVASLLEVGTGFHQELSGRENIFLNGTILGMKRVEIARKFEEIVDFAGIGAFIDTPVKRYSSGMYVRLAFAVAAHLEPEILIVDEVLAVGDVEFQKKCMGKMGSVAKEGRTVLLVSHNIGLMETLCRRAVLLRDGSVVSQGPTQQVVSDYLANTELSNSGELLHLPRQQAGTNVARFSRVRILDVEGNVGTDFKMGSGIVIALSIKTTERIAQPWVGITLRTALNQQLFHCANREAGYELKAIEHDCVVECKIDAINLLPGRYTLDLSLADARGAFHDELSAAAYFDVVVSDVLESGMPMDHQYGVIYFGSQWSVKDGDTP